MSGGKTAIWVAASALGVTGFGSDEPEASASMILGLERRSLGSQEFSTCVALESEETSNLILFPWGEKEDENEDAASQCITNYPNSYTNFYKRGGSKCPPGDAVTSIGACRAASDALGITYKREVDRNFRPGCFRRNGYSYFNINLEADPGNWVVTGRGVKAICGTRSHRRTWTGEAPEEEEAEPDVGSNRRLLSGQSWREIWCVEEFEAYCLSLPGSDSHVCSVCGEDDKTKQSEQCRNAATTFTSSCADQDFLIGGRGICDACTAAGNANPATPPVTPGNVGKAGKAGGNRDQAKTKCTIL